ncbi:MAG TPA: hypothetical protein VF299_11640 [Mycobacterium sp.]
MTLVTPQTVAGGPTLLNSVRLLSGSSALQTAIDQLFNAEQEVAEHVSQDSPITPFLTPFDLSRLPVFTHSLAGTMLATLINVNSANFNDLSRGDAPYPWNANGAEPEPFLTYTNPDDQYHLVRVAPDQTYVVTIDPGAGTQDVTFTPNSGDGVTTDFLPHLGIDLSKATPNPDGTYTIMMSPTLPQGIPEGNWVDTTASQTVLIRDSVGNWGLPHDIFNIQQEGLSPEYSLPVLSQDQIVSDLNTITARIFAEGTNPHGTYMGQALVLGAEPDNTFSPIQETSSVIPGISLPGFQVSTHGSFSLEPDQALIVKVPDVESAYSGLQLADALGQSVPYATVQGSLNDTQAFHDPDGYTYYVFSSEDPGVANWVDVSGLKDGKALLRWQDYTNPVPNTPVQTEVVPVADVRDYLPADTPTVSPAEYAADFKERLFEYDYRMDQDHNSSWITANLWEDQIRSVIGNDQYDALFGAQQAVPSMLDRLTDPALTPSMTTVAQDILANPSGSLSATVQNLPLLVRDVDMSAVFGVLRLDEITGQTWLAIQSAISSDQPSQVLTAFETGVQELGTALNQMWTDPTTSITAGLLNARDDLAVAIMNAGSYTPLSAGDFTSTADQFSQLDQSISQLLSGGLRYLLEPSDTTAASGAAADVASPAGDLASNAIGLSSDLTP